MEECCTPMYTVLTGAFGKCVDDKQSRSISSVHDQSAPTGFPAMRECSTYILGKKKSATKKLLMIHVHLFSRRYYEYRASGAGRGTCSRSEWQVICRN